MKLILLVDQNNAIAKDGKQITFLPEDLKHFEDTTKNQILVMGRKTYENIGKPLPNRINIVLTSKNLVHKDNLFLVHSIAELGLLLDALTSKKKKDIFCIGGAKIVEQLMPIIDEAILTRINSIIQGADTFIPDLSRLDNWVLEESIPLSKEQPEVLIEYWKKRKIAQD